MIFNIFPGGCENFFLFAINYFQVVVFREIKIKNSKRLFQNYLYSPYSLHLNRNPAIIIRDFFGQVHNACRFLDVLMICIREILIILAILAAEATVCGQGIKLGIVIIPNYQYSNSKI